MATTIFGKKKHMTQAFRDDGRFVSVTVIEAEPNVVTAVKTEGTDGYEAVQVGFGQVKADKVNKPHAGAFSKAGTPPRRNLREIRGETGEAGESIGVDSFQEGERVHVSSTSKGKGFQGTIKRHNFSRGPMTHGSHNIRETGSVGASADPSRIFPGRKMPGQMGNKTATVRNLEVVAVDAERNEIWVRGSVPGGKNTIVELSKAGE